MLCVGQLIAFLGNSQGKVTASGINGDHTSGDLIPDGSDLSISCYELSSFCTPVLTLPRTFSF